VPEGDILLTDSPLYLYSRLGYYSRLGWVGLGCYSCM